MFTSTMVPFLQAATLIIKSNPIKLISQVGEPNCNPTLVYCGPCQFYYYSITPFSSLHTRSSSLSTNQYNIFNQNHQILIGQKSLDQRFSCLPIQSFISISNLRSHSASQLTSNSGPKHPTQRAGFMKLKHGCRVTRATTATGQHAKYSSLFN